jgi:hypothetical protein
MFVDFWRLNLLDARLNIRDQYLGSFSPLESHESQSDVSPKRAFLVKLFLTTTSFPTGEEWSCILWACISATYLELAVLLAFPLLTFYCLRRQTDAERAMLKVPFGRH